MNWLDMPSLAALRGFEAAVRAGSFSAAARELNVTHAAVAQHVRSLEAHLGMSLLVRRGRQMVPTDAGARLALDLQDGFTQIINGVARLNADSETRPLSITCTPNFAENWLMPRLIAFWATHPDVRLSITPSNDVVDLRRDGYDVAIRYGSGGWSGTDSDFLVKGDYVAVVHRSLLGDRRPTCLSDLTDVPWFFCQSLPVYRAWAMKSGLDPSKIKEHELSTMSMVSAAVKAGAGASVMIKAMVEDDIAAGTLIVIEQSAQPGLGYHVVTAKGVLTPRVNTFRKWLISQRGKT